MATFCYVYSDKLTVPAARPACALFLPTSCCFPADQAGDLTTSPPHQVTCSLTREISAKYRICLRHPGVGPRRFSPREGKYSGPLGLLQMASARGCSCPCPSFIPGTRSRHCRPPVTFKQIECYSGRDQGGSTGRHRGLRTASGITHITANPHRCATLRTRESALRSIRPCRSYLPLACLLALPAEQKRERGHAGRPLHRQHP